MISRFDSILRFILHKRYYHNIETCSQLQFFIKGNLAAVSVYGSKDRILENFNLFPEFLPPSVKVGIKSDNWGKAIDQTIESDSVFQIFEIAYNAYFEALSTSASMALVKQDIYIGLKNFEDLMIRLLEIYPMLQIRRLADFDKFFAGFLAYGDHDKGVEIFVPPHDSSFVYLMATENQFKDFLKDRFGTTQHASYLSILVRELPKSNQVKEFLLLYQKFLQWRKR